MENDEELVCPKCGTNVFRMSVNRGTLTIKCLNQHLIMEAETHYSMYTIERAFQRKN